MRADPATVWFDVTTILAWQRPATGVVRVEAELFRQLRLEPSVRFCRFDGSSGSYHACDGDEVLATLERNALGTAAPRRNTFVRKVASAADGALRQAPLPIFKVLSRVKKASTPVVRGALHRWRETSRSLRTSRADARRGERVAPGSTTIFARGDVLVSAGLDWDFKDLPQLYRLKREHGFHVVLVCYDLIPVLFPHLCRAEVAQVFPRYYADMAWVADHVLCISESSRRDFLKYVKQIGAPLPRTSLMRLGSVPDAHAPAEVGHLVDGPFILFVSTIERRKNHDILYRALVRLSERGRPVPTLVFVGMPGWGVTDLLNDLSRDPRVRDRIVLLNHVTDAELRGLYARAQFTVFPSLYEGWGLPVEESFSHGRFCLAADTSSLREVGGDLAEYLDPWDVEAWADRLEFFSSRPRELQRREKRIAASFAPTPWSEAALAVLSVSRALAQR